MFDVLKHSATEDSTYAEEEETFSSVRRLLPIELTGPIFGVKTVKATSVEKRLKVSALYIPVPGFEKLIRLRLIVRHPYSVFWGLFYQIFKYKIGNNLRLFDNCCPDTF